MEKKRFRVGSIAVLFAVVILCVAVFAALTVVTAAQDLNVSQRYGAMVQQLYECENLGHQWVARATAASREGSALPEGTWEENGALCTRLETEHIQLDIRLRVTQDEQSVEEWNCVTKWSPQDSWELWK